MTPAAIPTGEATPSSFGAFLEAAKPTAHRQPPASTVAAVPLWGIDWTCSFDCAGRVQQVSIRGQWMPARATLRDSICDALELAYAEMPA